MNALLVRLRHVITLIMLLTSKLSLFLLNLNKELSSFFYHIKFMIIETEEKVIFKMSAEAHQSNINKKW